MTATALWFVEIAAGRVGRISMDGEIEEFAAPRPHGQAARHRRGVRRGLLVHRMGRQPHRPHHARPARSPTYDLPSPASEPHGITLGPDGALWVALETGTVARVAL